MAKPSVKKTVVKKTKEELYKLTIPQLNSIYNKLGETRHQGTPYGRRVWGHMTMKSNKNNRNVNHALTKVPASVIRMYSNKPWFLLTKKANMQNVFKGETFHHTTAKKLQTARRQQK